MNKEQMARKRAATILKVRSGQTTAMQAAEEMGVSRKTYYQWENKGLEGMIQSLEEQEPGRPQTPADPEKELMRQKIRELEQQLETAKQSEMVRSVLELFDEKQSKKKDKR